MLLICCEPTSYNNNYLSFTNYNRKDYKEFKTPHGVVVYTNSSYEFEKIDQIVDSLEICLNTPIKRDWFAVLIPDDWFYSTCSGEQLLPYAANPALCREKGLNITPECEWLSVPNEDCECTCNWRVATQDNYIIITTPNLKLLKPELARLVTGENNPYGVPSIKNCL